MIVAPSAGFWIDGYQGTSESTTRTTSAWPSRGSTPAPEMKPRWSGWRCGKFRAVGLDSTTPMPPASASATSGGRDDQRRSRLGEETARLLDPLGIREAIAPGLAPGRGGDRDRFEPLGEHLPGQGQIDRAARFGQHHLESAVDDRLELDGV